jgi:diadenosine tetraphosphate (Ap4A) HIT family hydrolase
MNDTCLFCDRYNSRKDTVLDENKFFYASWDDNPVSPGHILLIPKKHTVSFFNLDREEVLGMFELLRVTKDILERKYHPQGYNFGINEGAAAGQTINHLHIHLIPRYNNDVPNPKGGVRNSIPGKGDYPGSK